MTVRVSDPRKHTAFTRQLRSGHKVRALVAMAESLQRPTLEARSCPADRGDAAIVNLAFRRSLRGRALARMRIDENGCTSVSFWRGKAKQPYLEAGESIKVLHRLLGRRV